MYIPQKKLVDVFGVAEIVFLLILVLNLQAFSQTSFTSWQGSTSGAGAHPSDNLDGDLWDDLMEYAVGGDPATGTALRKGSTNKRVGIVLKVQESGEVNAELWHPSDVEGISYLLEKSTDLVNWTEVGAYFNLDDEDGGNVISWDNVNGSDVSGFVRLKVVLDGTDSVSFGVPMGWNTVSFRSLESTTYAGDAYQTYGPTLLPDAFYAGTVASVTGNSVLVRGGGGDNLRALWPANTQAYLEFTEGPAEGHRIEVSYTSSTAHTLALLLDSPLNTTQAYPDAMVGARFVLRTFNTPDMLFPKDKFQGGGAGVGADRFVRYVNGAWRNYYALMDIAGTEKRWVLAQVDGVLLPLNASRGDEGNVPLAPNEGFMVLRQLGAAAVSYIETGELRPWHQRCLINPVGSAMPGAYPFDQSPHDLGLGAPAGLLVSDAPYFSIWRRDVDIDLPSYQYELCFLGVSDQWQGVMLGSPQRDVTNLPVFYRSRAHLFFSRNREVAAVLAVPWAPTTRMLPGNPYRDTDEDGVSDESEVVAHTDPNDFFNGETPTMTIVSGDGLATPPNQWTAVPLVVQVWHSDGTTPWPHAPVTFTSTEVKVGSFAVGLGTGSVAVRAGSDGRASSFALMPATSGSHLGVTATSSTASKTFYLDANTAPIVSFLSPGTRASGTITFALKVKDADNESVTVTLMERATVLASTTATGTGTGAEVSLAWTSPGAGHHIVLAKAVDGAGQIAWAALPVEVAAAASESQALGPVEGGMRFTVAGADDDLRSNPFVLKPVFAAAVGTVNGSTLIFKELPGWSPGFYQSGYFIYVRSGAALGAVLDVTGNGAYTLTLAVPPTGLAAGDLIALIPKWSLNLMLPAETLPVGSNAYLAASRYAVPSITPYHRDGSGKWYLGTDTTPLAVSVYVEPWSCFGIVHATSGSTLFQPFGDVAAGPVLVTLAAHTAAAGFCFAPASMQPLGLTESGLTDAYPSPVGGAFVPVVRDTSMGLVDDVTVWAPGTLAKAWHFGERQWLPDSGSGDGSTLTLEPGGAVMVHRSPSAAANWLQPVGK